MASEKAISVALWQHDHDCTVPTKSTPVQLEWDNTQNTVLKT